MNTSLIATLPLIAACSLGQPKSEDETLKARDLLSEVAITYRSLNSFEWTVIFTTTSTSADIRPQTYSAVGAFRRPGHMRLDFPGAPIPHIEISDGKQLVFYYPSYRGFCRPDPALVLRQAPHQVVALGSSLPYEHITDGLREARILGSRDLKIGVDIVHCVLVTAIYAPAASPWTGATYTAPITYWIDPKTRFVLKQRYQATIKIPGQRFHRTDTATATVTHYRVNAQIPDARFTLHFPKHITQRPCSSFASGG